MGQTAQGHVEGVSDSKERYETDFCDPQPMKANQTSGGGKRPAKKAKRARKPSDAPKRPKWPKRILAFFGVLLMGVGLLRGYAYVYNALTWAFIVGGFLLLLPFLLSFFHGPRASKDRTERLKRTPKPPKAKKEKKAQSPKLKAQKAAKVDPSSQIGPQKSGDWELAHEAQKVEVAGVQFAEMGLETLEVGMRVDILPEPENPNDDKAIRLAVDGVHLGYIYKGKTREMLWEWIQKGLKMRAVVTKVTPHQPGVQLGIAFYKRSKYEALMASGEKSRVFRLTLDDSVEMQIAIDCCACGEEVFADVDYDTERPLVYAEGPIGYLPLSGLSYIDSHGDHVMFVEDKSIGTDGKQVVKVRIFGLES